MLAFSASNCCCNYPPVSTVGSWEPPACTEQWGMMDLQSVWLDCWQGVLFTCAWESGGQRVWPTAPNPQLTSASGSTQWTETGVWCGCCCYWGVCKEKYIMLHKICDSRYERTVHDCTYIIRQMPIILNFWWDKTRPKNRAARAGQSGAGYS